MPRRDLFILVLLAGAVFGSTGLALQDLDEGWYIEFKNLKFKPL